MAGSPYELVFQEIPIFVFETADHCADCSRVTDATMAVAPADMPVPTFDVSVTLDGAVIATDAFRDACEDVDGVVFAPLADAPGCWNLVVDRVVPIEPFDSHLRTGPLCATCEQPRYVIRSGPLHFDPRVAIESGFSRTDAGFGDTADFGSAQPVLLRPHVVVDRGTGQMLKAAGLLGVHLIAQP